MWAAYLMDPGLAICSASKSPLLDRAEGTSGSLGALLQLAALHLPSRGTDLSLAYALCPLLFFIDLAWPA